MPPWQLPSPSALFGDLTMTAVKLSTPAGTWQDWLVFLALALLVLLWLRIEAQGQAEAKIRTLGACGVGWLLTSPVWLGLVQLIPPATDPLLGTWTAAAAEAASSNTLLCDCPPCYPRPYPGTSRLHYPMPTPPIPSAPASAWASVTFALVPPAVADLADLAAPILTRIFAFLHFLLIDIFLAPLAHTAHTLGTYSWTTFLVHLEALITSHIATIALCLASFALGAFLCWPRVLPPAVPLAGRPEVVAMARAHRAEDEALKERMAELRLAVEKAEGEQDRLQGEVLEAHSVRLRMLGREDDALGEVRRVRALLGEARGEVARLQRRVNGAKEKKKDGQPASKLEEDMAQRDALIARNQDMWMLWQGVAPAARKTVFQPGEDVVGRMQRVVREQNDEMEALFRKVYCSSSGEKVEGGNVKEVEAIRARVGKRMALREEGGDEDLRVLLRQVEIGGEVMNRLREQRKEVLFRADRGGEGACEGRGDGAGDGEEAEGKKDQDTPSKITGRRSALRGSQDCRAPSPKTRRVSLADKHEVRYIK